MALKSYFQDFVGLGQGPPPQFHFRNGLFSDYRSPLTACTWLHLSNSFGVLCVIAIAVHCSSDSAIYAVTSHIGVPFLSDGESRTGGPKVCSDFPFFDSLRLCFYEKGPKRG